MRTERFVSEKAKSGCRLFLHSLGLLIMALAVILPACSLAVAQSDDAGITPYAKLDRRAVTYRGPVSTTEKDSPDGTAVIGFILPLRGAQQAEGKALLAAAQVALEQEQERGPLPDGRKLALIARDESGPWGQASSEILRLVEQDHAAVVVTSADGNIAHQAEQIANKISFPILTLASDPTTTETNVPWIFRMGPSDVDQARAFGQRIYEELGIRRVLLVVQTDHDGRVGRSEFDKVARELKADAPEVFEISGPGFGADRLAGSIQKNEPDAVVVWTDTEAAEQVVSVVRRTRPMVPVFLSTKGAQLGTQSLSASLCIAAMMEEQKLGESFTVVSLPGQSETRRHEFEQIYRARTGNAAGIAAFEAYQAVRLIAAGLRSGGTSRVLLRDYLAGDGKFRGSTTVVPFDPAGNNREEFVIVAIAEPFAH